jgi:predicted nucleotidyltransferase
VTTGLSESEMELLRGVFRRDPRIAEVRLFGSRAKGTHRSNSDIDLAVWGEISELQAERIAAELDELPLPYRFDVVSMSALRDDAVRGHIERMGRAVYRVEAPAK